MRKIVNRDCTIVQLFYTQQIYLIQEKIKFYKEDKSCFKTIYHIFLTFNISKRSGFVKFGS